MRKIHRQQGDRLGGERGFSLLELLIVVVIIAILMALAVPQAVSMAHMYRLRNAGSEFAGLVQQARSRSVRDSTYFAVRFQDSTPISEAYVDINRPSTPALVTTCQQSDGSDCDPVVSWAPEITPQAVGSAPATAALQSSWLSSTTGVTVDDGYSTSTPITFSPMGVPCVPKTSNKTCNSASGSTVLTAYWIFFQNTTSGQWEAVTVSPAGKIQKWAYSGSWGQL